MNNCLKGYVGIKGFDSAPISGRFVNQLPGISLENIQKIASKEQATFVAVFDEVQDRAWDRLSIDVKNRLRARFKIKTARTLIHIETGETTDVIPASANYRGLLIDSGLDNNGFFAFQVSSISVDLPQNQASVSIKIFDRTGHTLDTLQIANATAGLNTVQVNKAYAASRIFIAVDAAGVILNDTLIGARNYNDPFRALTGRAAGVTGGESTKANPAFVVPAPSTFGISAIMMPICDYTQMICGDRELFLSTWIYLLGAELMTERLYSDRINRLTTIENDEAEALRDLYTGQYENALDDAVDGIQITESDGCIDCREYVTRVERLP